VTDRRDVRPTRDFFEDLYRQLPAERGEDGTPSRLDFELYELVPIFDRFAIGWDDLPALIPGRGDYRVLIATGHLVHAYVVHGQLVVGGGVELVFLRIDPGPLSQ
jgi:hypothetical protein